MKYILTILWLFISVDTHADEISRAPTMTAAGPQWELGYDTTLTIDTCCGVSKWMYFWPYITCNGAATFNDLYDGEIDYYSITKTVYREILIGNHKVYVNEYGQRELLTEHRQSVEYACSPDNNYSGIDEYDLINVGYPVITVRGETYENKVFLSAFRAYVDSSIEAKRVEIQDELNEKRLIAFFLSALAILIFIIIMRLLARVLKLGFSSVSKMASKTHIVLRNINRKYNADITERKVRKIVLEEAARSMARKSIENGRLGDLEEIREQIKKALDNGDTEVAKTLIVALSKLEKSE